MASPNARNPYVQWYQQNKTLVWGAAAAAVTLYATYKVAASASATGDERNGAEGRAQKQQSQFQRLRSMVQNYSAAASTFAETAALVTEDLRAFLSSDSAELPQSLRQLNKLLQAPELQETVTTVTTSVVRGAMKATGGDRASDAPPLVDTIIEAVLSERGRGLIGMAVGVAMRNSTTALCEFVERRMEAAAASGGGAASLGVKDILDMLASDQGERVLTMLLTQTIRTAVTSYVDATSGYNLYNDMLASLVKQEHRDALTDLLSRISASFCREAVLSYRRTAAMGSVGGGFGVGVSGAASASSASTHAVNHVFSKHASVAAATSGATSGQAAASCVYSGAAVAAATAAAPEVASVSSEGGRSGAMPAVKSNGQLTGAQNARPSASSHLHKQQSLSGVLGGASSNALAMALGRGGMAAQTPPAWLRQVIELVKEREVRSLAVDVVKHASREATRGAVEGLLQGTGVGAEGAGSLSASSGILVLPPSATGYKLFVVATLAVTLCTYVLSPRVMLI